MSTEPNARTASLPATPLDRLSPRAAVAAWLAAVPVLCTAPGGAVVTVDGTPTAGSGSIDGAGAYTPPSGFLGTDLVTVGVVAGGGAARGTATLAVSVVDPDAPTGAGIGIGDVSVWEGDARTRSMEIGRAHV